MVNISHCGKKEFCDNMMMKVDSSPMGGQSRYGGQLVAPLRLCLLKQVVHNNKLGILSFLQFSLPLCLQKNGKGLSCLSSETVVKE